MASQTVLKTAGGNTLTGSTPVPSAIRKDVDGIHYVLHEDEFYVWCPKCMTPTYFQQYTFPPVWCRQCGDTKFFDFG